MAVGDLTAQRLRELLNYDPETGLFTRKFKTTKAAAGAIAGGFTGDKYWIIGVDGRRCLAHRLAWLYVYGCAPTYGLDHINGNRADNRISNLRDVPQLVNSQNRHAAKKGRKNDLPLGVNRALDLVTRPYTATIWISGERKHLGYFPTPEDAHDAYLKAKRIHHEGCTI